MNCLTHVCLLDYSPVNPENGYKETFSIKNQIGELVFLVRAELPCENLGGDWVGVSSRISFVRMIVRTKIFCG